MLRIFKDELFLLNNAIDSNYQNMGYGTKVLKKLINILKNE